MIPHWLKTRVQPLLQRVDDARFIARNRILSDPGFQRWSAKMPLFRIMARIRATALFDLGAGFVYSQVYQAIVRLRILEAVRDEPKTAEELAPGIDLNLDATRRLLDAGVSLQLLERRGEAYGLGIHGCSYVGNPAVAKFVEHHAMFYRDLDDPVALLRGELPETELNRFWSYADPDATNAEVGAYSELMAASISLMADDILEAYPVGRHQRLMDVGGGEGAFIEAVARRAPQLLLTLFDLPPVAERASARLARAGLSSRVRVHPGDAFEDPLPRGADVVSLVRILHDHEDDQALRLLRAVREAMEPGAVLLVAEPMRGTAGMERRMADAYFGFYLLAMGQGRPRSPAEVSDLLAASGFEAPTQIETRRPMLSQLISAKAG